MAANVQVFPSAINGGWTVHHPGHHRSRHRTQELAVSAGRRIARRARVDLVLWGRNGRIRSKDRYGNEGSKRDTEH